MSERLPTNLMEAVRYFSDPDVCVEFVAKLRWPDGWECPNCGGTEYSYLSTRRLWKCKACKKQTSVKKGTIFEDSALGLDKWLCAIWLIANSKNGISSHELGRSIGVTQKSAWFVLHRIRLAMQTGSFQKASGSVEVDETFIGGKRKNMHDSNPRKDQQKKGGAGKIAVAGVLERGGDVRAEVIPDRSRPTLHDTVKRNVTPGSALYTDAFLGYVGLGEMFDHETCDHAGEYVRGKVHTNGIENFWSLLKRSLHGTYVSVEPEHLSRYLDERVFAFNLRHLDDQGRFRAVLDRISGRRLTYAALTGKA